MSEYIERELALRIIIQKQKELCPLGTYGKKYVDGYNREKFDEWQEIIDGIESVPAADVAEVKHGKWEDYGPGVCCSECGISLFHQDTNNNGGIEPSGFIYCPKCGAKMDLED